MILFDSCGGHEGHPAYQQLAVANLNRQYDFLRSVILAAVDIGSPCLSQPVIKALNFHAITCLHSHAGEYRPCGVTVGTGPTQFVPAPHEQVPALMGQLEQVIHQYWPDADPVALATFVLWQLNHIHPFVNGNGRTARVAAYYILCVKAGGWLPGQQILPELIRANRPEYVAALKAADSAAASGQFDLKALHTLLTRLLNEQLASA